ncbi:hypothetical protein J3R83DRAFT_1581 [Lanmaoa asiatica]|nr:hypothetical protein J3R83DRAFT_1581 [Lanmaoa asiatica]
MEPSSADTLLSSSHPSRNGAWLLVWRPALSRAPPSPSWRTASDEFDPPVIAPCTGPDYPHIKFARNHALQSAPTQLLYADAVKVYPSPPSGSSTSKSTIPLPEEAGEFAPLYSTHVAGVLDSPPVMRREDLASQKPLTPPPTMPHPTLNLPDADVDIPFYDQDVEEIEEECETDESYPCPSLGSLSPHSVQSVLPLSPLSPSWDPPCAQALSIASSQDFLESEHLNALFCSCDASAPPALDYCHPSPLSPHKPSSLLEVDVDAPRPMLAPISIPWASSQPSEADPEPPSSSTSSSSLESLTDHDELPPPSSPLISRLDLPDLEDDGLQKILPSSPSRRSCSCLPDSDVEMGDSTNEPVLALPGQQLLSLPGADADDDLIPRIAAPACSVPFTPSQPLLLIDDPRDVPLPRSPSPEDFDLCLSPEDITDPELAKLFDLRKRSIAAERAARRLEALTEDVDLFTRAEARKIRKRERERSKEVGALLRLKLDGVPMCPQEQSPECDSQNYARRRGVIGNMSQLVAQMVFRRSETSRPLAKRKTANTTRDYVRSALSDAATVYE